jgi:hypothetical protein
MQKSDYILWLGCLFTDADVKRYRAVSPAANEWSYRFLYQLYLKGERIVTLGHKPEPYWPKGKLLISDKCDVDEKIDVFDGYRVPYYNIPYFRNEILKKGYLECYNIKFEKYGIPKAVFIYNLNPYSYELCSYLKNTYKIPWVVMVADSPTKDSYKAIEKHDTLLRKADGVALFSYSYYQKLKESCNAIHFEGGVLSRIEYVSEKIKSKERCELIIVYTGSRSKHSGYFELIESMKYVKSKNVKIWIAGPGIPLSNKGVNSDKRIKDYGFLNEGDLDKMMRRADFFISPYSIDHEPNEYNFPSKILLYLSYGKPIISTVTPGLSPEYKDVLCLLKDNNPKLIAEKIDEMSSLNDADIALLSNKVIDFVENNKSLDRQVDKFIEWLKNNVGLKNI